MAQSYSQKAKIDIYTLFPLVKMQIFDLAISEWQQAKEFEKRQTDSMSLALLGNDEERAKLGTEKSLELRLEKIKKLDDTDFEVNLEVGYTHCYNNGQYNQETQENEKVEACSYEIHISTDHSELKDIIMSLYQWTNLRPGQTIEQYIENLNTAQFNKSFLNYAKEYLLKKIRKAKENRNLQKYIKALYGLFDSVPILKTIPLVENEGLDYILKSINTLKLILNDKHIDLPLV